MKHLRTVSRGSGICIGHAWVLDLNETEGNIWKRCSFAEALEKASSELEALAKDSDIFAAHLEMIQDPMIIESFEDAKDEFVDDATACREAREQICAMFEDIDDVYLKARVDDVRDVFDRILGHIEGRSKESLFAGIPKGAVVVADNLAPSDTTLIDLDSVAGFITEGGSSTSHVCIIAASHGKPAAVGVADCTKEISNGDLLIVDAYEGLIFVNPTEEQLEDYRIKEKAENGMRNVEVEAGPIYAADGREIHVYGNAGNVDEVRDAIVAGADGIGLFRTEFLYMQSRNCFPGEETQFASYKEAVLACEGKPLTIRTLDIGGDKGLEYWNPPVEENPFLGLRAIRVSLSMPQMFKQQLRAVLRASAFGKIRLMFPMITSEVELDKALEYLQECKAELSREQIEYDSKLETGIMIETPAAVLIADELAAKVDFFSLGTNDLTQYVMAADRGNSAVSHIYDPFAPAVQKAIKMTIEAAHRNGIECCMCGELAGNPRACESLLDYGLDSFSVSAPAVKLIKSYCKGN